jgi:hypothetical protein
MSRPIHAACRASLEPMGWVLHVSRAAPHRCCVRSPSKLCTYAGRRKTGDSHLALTTGPASHMGDDLACLIAQNLSHYLR